MIVILNNKTHVGANPPSDTTKTWISADMTEISIYPEPETYGRLNERIDIKPILLAHNLDIKSNRIRIFSLADDVLEVKRYINGEWIVIDNPDNYVDIIMNGKVIGTMEVDSIAPGEQVEEWNGTGVIIEEIATEDTTDKLAGTWVFDDYISFLADGLHFGVNFTSNGNTYTLMSHSEDSGAKGMVALYYGSTEVFNPDMGGKWLSVSYKTINITSSLFEVTMNGELYDDESVNYGYKLLDWLKANATKQGATSLITFTIGGTSYQAEEGMTWGEWVESDYNTNGYTKNSDNLIISSGGAAVVNSSFETVQASYEIISGSAYKLFQGGGA